jgi:beta-phosphoglucomutase-like phosphatase (HAD superfamily)
MKKPPCLRLTIKRLDGKKRVIVFNDAWQGIAAARGAQLAGAQTTLTTIPIPLTR